VVGVNPLLIGLRHELQTLFVLLGKITIVAALKVIENPEFHGHSLL
jgi:hypothetical protein